MNRRITLRIIDTLTFTYQKFQTSWPRVIILLISAASMKKCKTDSSCCISYHLRMLPSSCVSIFRAPKSGRYIRFMFTIESLSIVPSPTCHNNSDTPLGPQTSLLVSCNAVLYYLYDTPFAAFSPFLSS